MMNVFQASYIVYTVLLNISYGNGLIVPALPRHYGQKIENKYTIHKIKPTSVYTCAQVCYSMKVCKYFNFNVEQMSCELKYLGSPIPSSATDFYVKATEIAPEYADNCANHSCTNDEICFGKTNGKHDCLRLHIECGMPKPIPNAEMEVTQTLLYNATIYTCHNETIALPLLCHTEPCINKTLIWDNNKDMYCMPDRHWEGSPIDCIECFDDPHKMVTTITTTLTGRTCRPWSTSNDFTTSTFYNSSVVDSKNYCRSPKTNPDKDRPYLWCLTDDASMPVDICPIPRCYGNDVGTFDKQIPGIPPYMYGFTQHFADVPLTYFTCTNPNSTESFENCPVSRYEHGKWSPAHLSCSDRECFESGRNYTGQMACTVSGRTCQYWNSTTPHAHSFVLSDPEDHNSNYCRNPDGNDKVPWCFTNDPLVRYEHCWIPKC